MKLKMLQELYNKFDVPIRTDPVFPEKLASDRLRLLQEELSELITAVHQVNEPEILDGLVDLQVVLLGTVITFGYQDIFNEAFYEVMKTNLAKESGVNNSRPGMSHDLIKPNGWVAPNLESLLCRIKY